MTSGFHLKLAQPAANNEGAVWEPDTSNRVWRPCDGASLWLKSGQCDVRKTPLALTQVALEVLYSAALSTPPRLVVQDLVQKSVFPLVCTSVQPYGGSSLFKVGAYNVPIYPETSYAVTSQENVENPAILRLFPADPSSPDTVSRFVLGASAWVDTFPTIALKARSIKPQPVSSFTGGLSVQVSIGNGPSYETVPATRQLDGTWQATLKVAIDTTPPSICSRPLARSRNHTLRSIPKGILPRQPPRRSSTLRKASMASARAVRRSLQSRPTARL
jgi:hypothetical protein